MGGEGRVEVVDSTRCSRLFLGLSYPLSSSRGLPPFGLMSPASSSACSDLMAVQSTGPFAGLVICVTGLSKEARKQVMEATERLGGQYSPNLHPQCTHLVVQGFGGRKFEHALKHGPKTSLFMVTLGWFVDSVKRNVRLSESLYGVQSCGENGLCLGELNTLAGYSNSENSCLPVGVNGAKQLDMIEKPHLWFSGREFNRSSELIFPGSSMYIDPDISAELQNKVVEAAAREGAKRVEKWFVGCSASHVVCEGTSVQPYLGHSSYIVTPLWILKTAKEKHVQRLVHISTDLARQIGTKLEGSQKCITGKVINEQNVLRDDLTFTNRISLKDRQQVVNSAKISVRSRRAHHYQTCKIPIRPITPSCLLDSISWSISEPTSTASLYMDSFSFDGTSEHHSPIFLDTKGNGKDSEASFANLTRPLTESEKSELVFKNHFLTILFPIDRFAEMGPSSRTFFSDNGFTCLQVLDHIYAFYQENMSVHEIEAAIHTDSRHADLLRSAYCSRETVESGFIVFKRIDFLGSRRSFEMLKRVAGDNNSNVYELLIKA